ncbi:hypothetical protein RJ639_028018 [Escallonia herrerae]|uniref:Amidase domain-containing protein n=1 Tax=Escallonia herrerae TaxID=1293975 RepID=A0AA89BJ49_9ASTE|nr:hypothetical protein RJ639_028018 [Escallonia herrerae]
MGKFLNLEKIPWERGKEKRRLSRGGGITPHTKGEHHRSSDRCRNRQMQFHQNIFAKADVIVTPTTGVTAYTIKDDCLESGELDYINGAALVRYQIAGNFLGLPAVTVPVGYDNLGLPIGLQFIGKPWSEPTLIQIAFALQALRISDYRKPQVFYDLLQKEGAKVSDRVKLRIPTLFVRGSTRDMAVRVVIGIWEHASGFLDQNEIPISHEKKEGESFTMGFGKKIDKRTEK